MSIIETIKAEVERLKKEGEIALQDAVETNDIESGFVCGGIISTCGKVLAKLDTIQEQPVELEKEINDYISKHFFGSQTQGFFSSRTHGDIDCVDIVLVARHFAQWGAEHLASAGKMIEPEKKEGRTDCSPQGEVPNGNLATQSYENIPNDLEEAAKAYADDINSNECLYTYTDFTDAFKAGAKWQMEKDLSSINKSYESGVVFGMNAQKEQMLKDAVEGTLYEYRGILMAKIYVPHPEQFKPEDVNVKVLIIKGD